MLHKIRYLTNNRRWLRTAVRLTDPGSVIEGDFPISVSIVPTIISI